MSLNARPVPTTTYVDRARNATARRSACDWCTTTGTHDGSAESLWKLGVSLLGAGELEGQHASRWHAHGYRGWSLPGCAFGERPDGVVLRLSGRKAAENWQHACTTAENCTRLDLCTDLYFDTPVVKLAQESYVKSAHCRTSTGRPPGRRLIVSGDGGSTFYTGSRASQRMGRLYDKGVESKTLIPGKWWRWEIEFKAESAKALSAAALSAPDFEYFTTATVASFFARRCAIAPTSSENIEIYNLSPEPTSDDVLLSWLARGVRPTVARLIERVGHERVTFSLGLAPSRAVE